MMRRVFLVPVFAGVLLSGCTASTISGAWQCPLVQGKGCLTVAQADPAAGGGAWGKGSARPRSYRGLANRKGRSMRRQEVVDRIWIAAFVDENGVFHGPSYIWVVIEPARWRVD